MTDTTPTDTVNNGQAGNIRHHDRARKRSARVFPMRKWSRTGQTHKVGALLRIGSRFSAPEERGMALPLRRQLIRVTWHSTRWFPRAQEGKS
jgi:hypothetical protein